MEETQPYIKYFEINKFKSFYGIRFGICPCVSLIRLIENKPNDKMTKSQVIILLNTFHNCWREDKSKLKNIFPSIHICTEYDNPNDEKYYV